MSVPAPDQSGAGLSSEGFVEKGIYPGLSIKKYHASYPLSKTGLCLLDEAPALFKSSRDGLVAKKEESPSLRFGSALHAKMDGSFADDYVIGPEVKSRAEKAWKDFCSKHPERIVLKPSENKLLDETKEAVLSFMPTQKILAAPGAFEVSYVWDDPMMGVRCKARPDFISADQRIVIDFKTARDAHHLGFQRSAYEHGYYVSAAHTLDGVRTLTGVEPEAYIFLVVQSSNPPLVAAYRATEEEIHLGREFIRRNLALYLQCERSGEWPGLAQEILPLGLPRYGASELQKLKAEYENFSQSIGW